MRTSHYRAVPADTSQVAGRLLPYALMSAYAYKLGDGCAESASKQSDVTDGPLTKLESEIAETVKGHAGEWGRIQALSINDSAGHFEWEDNEGLAYHVWEKRSDGQKFVVVAFRGTSGEGDWKYGNLWRFTRFICADNQYSRASAHMHSSKIVFDPSSVTAYAAVDHARHGKSMRL